MNDYYKGVSNTKKLEDINDELYNLEEYTRCRKNQAKLSNEGAQYDDKYYSDSDDSNY